jgi:hypothetical protein
MKIKRVIRVFNISDEELVTEILLKNKDSERIKKLFKANNFDQNHYGIYEIGVSEFNIISHFLPTIKKYNLKYFELYFTAYTI